jgi:hypothetical protein
MGTLEADMKTRTTPTTATPAPPRIGGLSCGLSWGLSWELACGITRGLTRRLHRVWLQSRIDTYMRNLHAIAAQRENDFHAERILHRAISATRSKLQSL